MADSWSITGQRQTTDLGPDGRFVDVWEITYQTTSGRSGSVRVPKAQYTADRVRQLVDAEVAEILAVDDL